MAATKQFASVFLPYFAAGAIFAGVVMGKISPELGMALAAMLALPSPVSHALASMKPPAPPEE